MIKTGNIIKVNTNSEKFGVCHYIMTDEKNEDVLVDCRKEYGGFKIKEAPPNECPYKLEHLLKEDE